MAPLLSRRVISPGRRRFTRWLALGLLTAAGQASVAAAQTPGLRATPSWYSGMAYETYALAWGDADRDGDLDLVCGNHGQSTLFLNEGGGLSTLPAWTSKTASTRSVAWGDVDGDGDLDLACGNWYERSFLYLNEGDNLSPTPVWTSATLHTLSVAWADVDGDGDLDLACGSTREGTTLYLNEGGNLSTTPAWTSPSALARCVVWGDVDGDGNLDLVCGNLGAPSLLYLNEGDGLSATPAWMSMAAPTHSVALGDVDGDGDLDLACGNWTQPSTLYLNEGGTLSATPTWNSVPANTNTVTWGDVDGDGDLDLLCGNFGQSTFYLNEGGSLSPAPAWNSLTASTLCAAWGDVDGDGDLDLACGNRDESSTAYMNDGRILPTTPTWSVEPGAWINQAALGDVDGDGDLDLAFGGGTGGALHLNEGGKLSSMPVWISQPATTLGIAWGDVDGDGDLDLACGNSPYGGASSTLYLNEGGSLSAAPAWAPAWPAPPAVTSSVAWGDVDGDGDLDLACGNSGNGGTSSTLYLNEGGSLATTPAWVSEIANTLSLAWADVDGDGDLDLACGNFGRNTLYLGEGGSLSPAPAWTSESGNTHSLAWGDVDGDGDPDLACGDLYEGSHFYLNEGGRLSSAPAWTSERADTYAVAWGDADGDGDLDLVCGNEGWSTSVNSRLFLNDGGRLSRTPAWVSEVTEARSVAWGDIDDDGDLDLVCAGPGLSLHDGLGAPAYRGAPELPANHLPNNGVHLRSVRTTEPDGNVLRVSFQARDVESDPFFVTPQYHFEGDPRWFDADLAGEAERAGPFASSPAGTAGSFDWDLQRLPFDRRPVVLRLLLTEIPGRVSVIQHVAPYLKLLAPLVPQRPQALIEATALPFPTVTVGDTTRTTFTLRNIGNEILQVSDLILPSAEMSAAPAPSFSVQPESSVAVEIALTPRAQLQVAGDIVIVSNDPLAPSLALPVQTEILPLAFSTRFLRSEASLPLGEAATVLALPRAGVRIERGTLSFRPAGSGTAFDQLALVPSDEGFWAIVPGSSVTEAGLEYYVQVENSGLYATDPPGAPGDVFFQPVQPPSLLTISAQANSEGAFPQFREVPLRLDVTVGTEVLAGQVFYRPGGVSLFDSVRVQGQAPVLSAILPAAAIGPRGVEYFARLRTLTTSLTVPPGCPSTRPYGIQVRVLGLAEPQAHPEGRYRLLSLPLVFQEDFTGSLVEALGGLGPYDPLEWRAFRYLTAIEGDGAGRTVELSADPSLFRPEPGRGFWLISRAGHRLATVQPGYSTPTAGPYPIVLAPGWNQIGNPFAFPVAWEAVGRGEGIEVPVAFDPALGGVGDYAGDPVAALMPFEGYFLYNAAAAAETLWVPAREAPAELIAAVSPQGTLPAGRTVAEVAPVAGEWSLRLAAAISDGDVTAVSCGVAADAAEGRDARDRRQPPARPGVPLQLAIDDHEWPDRGGFYRDDFRPSAAAGHRWDLVLCSPQAGATVDLRAEGLAALPAQTAVLLVDLEQGTRIDLRRTAAVSLVAFGADRPYRLALLAGAEEYVAREGAALTSVPATVVFDANSPNPFNPATRIRFGLPSPSAVSLAVFDVRGVRVAALLEEEPLPAGYHSLVWDGRDSSGRRVATGVYFCRLVAQGRTLTRKMLLVK